MDEGLKNELQKQGVFTTTLEDIYNWGRKNSIWPKSASGRGMSNSSCANPSLNSRLATICAAPRRAFSGSRRSSTAKALEETTMRNVGCTADGCAGTASVRTGPSNEPEDSRIIGSVRIGNRTTYREYGRETTSASDRLGA